MRIWGFFCKRFKGETYKFEQERVFTQRSDTTGEAKDEHHTTHHQEEPDWVKTAQVGDGWDVGEDPLIKHSMTLEELLWLS